MPLPSAERPLTAPTRMAVMHREIVACVVVLASASVVVGQRRVAAGAQGTRSDVRQVPRFQVDPTWPKIPHNWQLGQVSSVAIDSRDHVWVLQRPATLSPEEKPRAAPPHRSPAHA